MSSSNDPEWDPRANTFHPHHNPALEALKVKTRVGTNVSGIVVGLVGLIPGFIALLLGYTFVASGLLSHTLTDEYEDVATAYVDRVEQAYDCDDPEFCYVDCTVEYTFKVNGKRLIGRDEQSFSLDSTVGSGDFCAKEFPRNSKVTVYYNVEKHPNSVLRLNHFEPATAAIGVPILGAGLGIITVCFFTIFNCIKNIHRAR